MKRAGDAGMRWVLSALLLGFCATTLAQEARRPEPNTRVPKGMARYTPNGFPDRIVASPAQDASTGFSVAWRTDTRVSAPQLEIVVAGDSPDMGEPRRIKATSTPLETENGEAHHHRADVDGLQPDTLYAWRVQGDRTWSAWHHTRTAAAATAPLTLLYFGDTQNKNVSLTTRVVRAAVLGLQRRAGSGDPARLAHVRRIAGDDDLQQRRIDLRVRAPCHREAGARIPRRRGHDAIRESGWCIAQHALGHARVRLRLARRRFLRERRRAGPQQQHGQCPRQPRVHCALHSARHSGSDSAFAISRQSNAATA